MWTGEHVALPIQGNRCHARRTPFLDSIGALTRVAALTTRLRLGTGILVLPHHNPVMLAKALATLDVLSGGRLIAGFGGGYAEAEFRAIGVDFHRRGAITDDSLRAIRALWTQEEPAHDGRFARFAGIRFEPKPIQRPHPPIVVGGQAPGALARAAREGDGWYGFALTVAQTAPIVTELARLRHELGRATPVRDLAHDVRAAHARPGARGRDAGIHRLIVFPMVAAEKLGRPFATSARTSFARDGGPDRGLGPPVAALVTNGLALYGVSLALRAAASAARRAVPAAPSARHAVGARVHRRELRRRLVSAWLWRDPEDLAASGHYTVGASCSRCSWRPPCSAGGSTGRRASARSIRGWAPPRSSRRACKSFWACSSSPCADAVTLACSQPTH